MNVAATTLPFWTPKTYAAPTLYRFDIRVAYSPDTNSSVTGKK
jgi:hypothetical protein